MATYKTPGVYVEEISTFPPSVAEVGTAIPAFIGYTETAIKVDADDLELVPTKIYSQAEYELYYGGPKEHALVVGVEEDATTGEYTLTAFTLDGANQKTVTGDPTPGYLLYHSVKQYFDNGGAQCYIVSVGSYADTIDKADFIDGLDAVSLEDEPTLLVVPEAVKLGVNHYGDVATAMLSQCTSLGDRFGILDVWSGYAALSESVDDGLGAGTTDDAATVSRSKWGTTGLKYGAAYYPYLKTTSNHQINEDSATACNVTVNFTAADGTLTSGDLVTLGTSNTAVSNFVKSALLDYYITLPPSGAVAGVYAATDAARGVWKAPANVGLAGVIQPVVKIDNSQQDGLNVDATSGKSINVIRAFTGKGSLVWGARTLAGNDNEWRYVPVRRFFNMVEESVMKSTQWAVFEPNAATTWVKVRGMIENYLIDKWREGALAGASPKDAFYVRCGIGTTMTAQDILEGRMNVEIGMAVVRPAEFIVLKFSHKLQTS